MTANRSQNEMLTYGSLFTGVGGFDLGFDRAGMHCAFQVEQDKTCQSVLARHWPGVHRGNDVCTVTPGSGFAPVDVLCGGFPCQDLSVAGRRKGLAGERSGLFWQFHRIAQELAPRVFVLENVPGLYSSHGGRDLLSVIRGMEELGYRIAWCCLDSEYFHVPQRRERTFIVGCLGTGSAPQILFESESVRGDSPPSREKGQSVAGTLGGSSQSGGFRTTDLDNNGAFIEVPQIAKPLGSHSLSKGRGSDLDNTTYIGFGCKDYGQDCSEGVAPTLRSMNHREGNSNGGGQLAVAFAQNQRNEVRELSVAGSLGSIRRGDAKNETVIAIQEIGKRQSGTSMNGVGHSRPGDPMFTLQQSAQHGVFHRNAVRRLTPRECERLQGFPDDWTRWDADGKEISDSARYRMLGNAVTTYVAEWIGRRIVSVIDSHPLSP